MRTAAVPLVLALAAVSLAGSQAGAAPGPPLAAAGSYRSPVAGPLQVLRPFRAPRTRYGPGHRGVDLAAAPGAVITAAAAGVVRFAGPVAGRGVVVILHPDGVRTEYEPLRPLVSAGARVALGTPIGVLRGRHPGCRRSCLHWGARLDSSYFDPLRLLVALGPVVLLP
jgi:murein DD-endopeptidase MepM/ murein hydrolase activator NlpD